MHGTGLRSWHLGVPHRLTLGIATTKPRFGGVFVVAMLLSMLLFVASAHYEALQIKTLCCYAFQGLATWFWAILVAKCLKLLWLGNLDSNQD
ncbi:hypothetical protein CIT26_30850 [Mesorhizobium temperatum]|uniref:Uncharacterized protein n=1 Tax=Mesorhizobium temperatum TaxID=241416 RepID=A0A271LAS3_9HYPH|nr:hypothetical protein CIT26_30850 [Mesorhizobium temperatum]